MFYTALARRTSSFIQCNTIMRPMPRAKYLHTIIFIREARRAMSPSPTENNHEDIDCAKPLTSSSLSSLDGAGHSHSPSPPSLNLKSSESPNLQNPQTADRKPSLMPDAADRLSGSEAKKEKPKFIHAITQKVVTLAIEEFKQPETIQQVKDHILAPLVKLIYAQIYPYLIVGAIVMLCALIMWVLMFLMFTMAFFKSGRA